LEILEILLEGEYYPYYRITRISTIWGMMEILEILLEGKWGF
jgi:hypothetical protein